MLKEAADKVLSGITTDEQANDEAQLHQLLDDDLDFLGEAVSCVAEED